MTWEGVIYWLLNKMYVPTLHLHLLFSQQNVLTRYNRLTRDVIKGWEEEGKESLHLSMGNMYKCDQITWPVSLKPSRGLNN